MTSSPPCWWTKTKDLSLASFVRPPEVVDFSIVIGVSGGWLKTSYTGNSFLKLSRNIVALQVETLCCSYYRVRDQLVSQRNIVLQVEASCCEK